MVRLPPWGDQHDFDMYWEEVQIQGDAVLHHKEADQDKAIAIAASTSSYSYLPLGVSTLLYSAHPDSLLRCTGELIKTIGPLRLEDLLAHDIRLRIKELQRTGQ